MTFVPPEIFNISEHFLGDRIAEGMAGRRAILTDKGEFTYGDVQESANRFGNLLKDAGVQPEQRVIIALPDGPEYVGALFGILRMGAVPVMVNPHLKPEQIRYFYEYTGARAAFVGTDVFEAFTEALEGARSTPQLHDVGGDDFAEALNSASTELEPFPTHRDDAAIWLFSGGTTGDPKAVVQSHRSFANTTELYGRGILDIGPDDITLSVPKLFFGYATGSNLLFPFSVGATTALFPERCVTETLFEKIAAFRPTILVNVPTMVNHLVAHAEAEGQDLSSIRVATSAGEALPVELHRRWEKLFGVPLLDGLGTAEMWHIFISNRIGDVKPGTLGRVVDGFDVRVRDDDGKDLPSGEIGHLWVKGDSRANGYWRQMEKTQGAFRGEWYVSGDMISMDEDGFVTYCGRGDDMLKVSGKWLAPGELENCLLEHPAVKEVAVVGVRSAEGLIKPEAFVVLEDGKEPRPTMASDLQGWAKSRLEPYKYPRAVRFMDDLPRTHLGKVDRGKLAARGDPG